MKRTLVLVYGALSYAVFFATFVYAVGFVGDLWVPRTIDGAPRLPDVVLLGVFALLTTAYILIAIQLEERDLAEALPEYRRHRERVPMLVPRLSEKRRWSEESA